MNDLIKSVDCADCKGTLRNHVNKLVMKWVLLDVSPKQLSSQGDDLY